MTSAHGQDRSDYQAVTTWAGENFGWCKATNGPDYVDEKFTDNWAGIARANIPRGAYHELTDASAEAQADFFVATVKARGLRPGDMLAVVASDYPGVTDTSVKAFCDRTAYLAGPHCPVLVYTDLSVAKGLWSCGGYDLWATWPGDVPPGPVGPWKTWRFWQYSISGPVDLDVFNGTVDDLRAWLATYTETHTDPPPPPSIPFAVLDQEEPTMLLLPKGTPTPIAIPDGANAIRFTTVFGSSGTFPSASLSVNWHGTDLDPVAVTVDPQGTWPVLTIPAGVEGACVYREDTGTHYVAATVYTETKAATAARLAQAAAEQPEAA